MYQFLDMPNTEQQSAIKTVHMLSHVHITPSVTTALLLPVHGCGTIYRLMYDRNQLLTIQMATENISV